jgi:predicted nucleic acid-binding protein
MKIIIADSSTLITLLDINNFSLLFELFEEIIITDEVYNEITYNIYHKKRIDDYLSLKKMTLKSIEHNDMYEMLRKRLDSGESESITLAKKLQLPLIIDEKKGRKVAQSLGIKIIGFVGIILKLLEKEIIPKSRALEIVQEVEENNFRLSEGLKELIYSF